MACSSSSRSGRPRTTRTAENIQIVHELLDEDCQISTRQLADFTGISKTAAFEIVTQDLQLRNVSAVWIPHNLSDANRVSRVNCAKEIRRLFFQEGMSSFCNKLVVQDETFVYLHGLPNKQQNRCWIAAEQSRPRVTRRTLFDKKVMLMVAFTPNGRFSVRALPPKETVDSDVIISFVRHTGDLWRSLRSKKDSLE
jgi:hypothetical protein